MPKLILICKQPDRILSGQFLCSTADRFFVPTCLALDAERNRRQGWPSLALSTTPVLPGHALTTIALGVTLGQGETKNTLDFNGCYARGGRRRSWNQMR